MHGMDILWPTVLLLGSGFIVILLSRVIRISPIVGFVLAGLILGPQGFGVIENNETTLFLAELGVVFLLFDIGLHFSFKSAWSMRRDLFILAPLQMAICGVVLGFALTMFSTIGADMALLAGLALALSSTAIVMQVLADQKQGGSPVGHSAKAVLIFQDIAAIFLLIFADAVGGDQALGMMVGSAVLKTALAFVAAIILGQYVLTPLMRAVTRYDDPEMFTVLGLLIVMLTGLLTASAGLSITLGAFLAGMVLAETPFRVLLQTELRPFRSLLMALFFIKVGMMIDPASLWQEIDVVLSLLLLILTLKAAVIGALAFVMKRPTHRVIQLAFLLAQGSEFAFVIFSMAGVTAGIGEGLTQQLIAAVALSMLLTPFISLYARRWSVQVCETLQGPIANCPEGSDSPVSRQPVLIVGMNEVGKTLARGLKTQGIPYIAVDHDRKRFLDATAAGYIVAYGQTSDIRFWNALGIGEARAVCLASPRYEVARTIAPILNKLYPKLRRFVAVEDSADGVRFATLGMKPFNARGAPPGLEMTCAVLREMGAEEQAILDWVDEEHSGWLENNKSLSQDDKQQLSEASA